MNKHWAYVKYLARHKWFVLVAGRRIGGIPLWRLLIHDWSKLLPCEWQPYAEYFYGTARWLKDQHREMHAGILLDPIAQRYLNTAKAEFDAAWLHHIHLNPHHWEHWVLRYASYSEIALEMPTRLWREMVADWMGAGRAITGRWDVAEWYATNLWTIKLAPETRRQVENTISEAR